MDDRDVGDRLNEAYRLGMENRRAIWTIQITIVAIVIVGGVLHYLISH